MIKIVDCCILCKWANLQNQQGVKYLFPPLYIQLYPHTVVFTNLVDLLYHQQT